MLIHQAQESSYYKGQQTTPKPTCTNTQSLLSGREPVTSVEQGEVSDDRQPWSHHATPPGRLDRPGMLDGTRRSTIHEHELNDDLHKKGEQPHRPRRTRSRRPLLVPCLDSFFVSSARGRGAGGRRLNRLHSKTKYS